MKVIARHFVAALKPAVNVFSTVTLESDAARGALSVVEASHGLFGETIVATGCLEGPVQVDGRILHDMLAQFPPESELLIEVDNANLTVRMGGATRIVPRQDGGGATPIKMTKQFPDTRHKGKVSVPPEPKRKRVELADTWAFSARVPMPEHSDPKVPHYKLQK